MDTRPLRRLLSILILTLATLTALATSTALLTRADPSTAWWRSLPRGQ